LSAVLDGTALLVTLGEDGMLLFQSGLDPVNPSTDFRRERLNTKTTADSGGAKTSQTDEEGIDL